MTSQSNDIGTSDEVEGMNVYLDNGIIYLIPRKENGYYNYNWIAEIRLSNDFQNGTRIPLIRFFLSLQHQKNRKSLQSS